jgi:hypothetical protein
MDQEKWQWMPQIEKSWFAHGHTSMKVENSNG